MDLTLALDPARLFRRANSFAPDPWQVRVLRSQARQILLNCSRQAGKSTVTACLGLHAALYQAPALVLIVTPTLRQSQEVFKRVQEGYRVIAPDVPPLAESALRLELPNGSRIIALPGDESTIRSYSAVALLIVDEASRVPDPVYHAVRPMLAVSQGRIVVLSTPFGQRGFFHDAWVNGGLAWHRESVPATQIPRIPPAFLEEERRALGPWYGQEYECSFMDNQFQLYSTSDIDQAVRSDVLPLFGAMHV
jgi:hypothetical protein